MIRLARCTSSEITLPTRFDHIIGPGDTVLTHLSYYHGPPDLSGTIGNYYNLDSQPTGYRLMCVFGWRLPSSHYRRCSGYIGGLGIACERRELAPFAAMISVPRLTVAPNAEKSSKRLLNFKLHQYRRSMIC
jgi:hypothetical protein